MSTYIVCNGDIIKESSYSIPLNNRAFAYGDSVFESMVVHHGQLLFVDLHLQRLLHGLQSLQIIPPQWLASKQYKCRKHALSHISVLAKNLCLKNNLPHFARLRLICIRKGGQYYTPTDNSCDYILLTMPLEKDHYHWQQRGLHMDYYHHINKNATLISSFKSGNSALYVMASKYASENKMDDVVLLNPRQQIIETSRANIFFYYNGVFITPPVANGGVAGVMRSYTLGLMHGNGIACKEQIVTTTMAAQSQEAFTTNAVGGIKWIAQLGKHKLINVHTKVLHALFLESISQQ